MTNKGYRILGLPVLGACLFGALASNAIAENTFSGALSSEGRYWTADRLLKAKSLDAARPSVSLDALLAAGEALQPSGRASPVSGDGAPPAFDLSEADYGEAAYALDQAGDGTLGAAENADALDAGTSNAYFTSSRLIPIDARLTYPYRAAGKLFFTQPGVGDFVCSAAVLRPRIILTAGHCAHSGSDGADGFFANFEFIPAFDRGKAELRRWTAVWAVTTGSWANSGNTFPNRADFAILEMRDQRVSGATRRIGEITGYYGFQTNVLLPNHVKMLGYPVNFDRGEIMHQVDAGHAAAAAAETVLYGSDMLGGSSGGPWVENFGRRASGQTGGQAFRPNRIVGVTSFGFLDNPEIMLLGSSTLNDEFLAILDLACNRRSGNC